MDLYSIPDTIYLQPSTRGLHLLRVTHYVQNDPHAALMLMDALRDRGYRVEFSGPGFIIVGPLPQAPEPTL